MSVHAVYVPGRIASGGPDSVEAAVIVRERFSVPAALLPLPWLLFRRAWREFLLFAALTVAAAVLTERFLGGASQGAMAGLQLLTGLFIGVSAADIRGRALERRGYRLADVVVAPDADAALLRFAERETPVPRIESVAVAASGIPRTDRGDVIGLFPEAGR